MSKYKVGDKVFFEGVIIDTEANSTFPYRVKFSDGSDEIFREEILCFFNTYEDGYKDGYKKGKKEALMEVVNCEDAKYNQGMNDAWELARKIGGMTRQAWHEIFKIEDAYFADILDDNTPQQALAKIEAYEESKAIKVGDVVSNPNFGEGVILEIRENGQYNLFANGQVRLGWDGYALKKTGKHIDIESLLELIN